MKGLFYSVALAMIVSMTGCDSKKDSSANDLAIEQAFDRARDNFFNTLNSPDETSANLMRIGADFNAGLIHDPSQWGMYTTSKEKAAATLGIYLSDLNYSVAFGQRESTTALFDAVHNLSLKVGIEKQVLEYLSTRYKKNIDQNDSVKQTINQMYARAIQSVKGTENEILVGIAIGAHQIEDLHLMMGIIKTYPQEMLPDDVRLNVLVPLFQEILNERPNLEIVNEFLEAITNYAPPQADRKENQEYYLNAFKDLIKTYEKLTVQEKIRENRGMELVSDAVIMELDAKVEAIRNKVLSAE